MEDALKVSWLLVNEKVPGVLCVSGDSYLGNCVTGVHIMDNPDTIRFFKQGEIMLTTGYLLQQFTETDFKELVEQLSNRGCSGIVFKINRYFDEVPEKLCKFATRESIPVLSVPYQCAIADVEKVLLHELFSLENKAMFFSRELYENIVGQIRKGLSLSELCDYFATQIERDVFFLNPRGTILCSSSQNFSLLPGDRFLLNKDMEQLKDQMVEHGVPCEIRTNMDEKKQNFWLWQICLNNKVQGYVCVSGRGEDASGKIFDSISYVMPLLQIEIMNHLSATKSGEDGKQDCVKYLLCNDFPSPEDFLDFCKKNNLDIHLNYVCIVFWRRGTQQQKDRMMQHINEVMKGYDGHIYRGKIEHLDVFLWGLSEDGARERLFWLEKELMAVKKKYEGIFNCGIGRLTAHLEQIKESFREAKETMEFQHVAGMDECSYDTLYIYHFMRKNLSKAALQELYNYCVKPLVLYDEKYQTELYKTLKVLVQHQWSIKSAAEIMYIHRNTMAQRVEKIRIILGDNYDRHKQLLEMSVCAGELLEWEYGLPKDKTGALSEND